MRTAFFLRHTPYLGPDLVGVWAQARGFAVAIADAPNFDAAAIANADLLIILGGNMGVYDTGEHPWIETEIALTRARLHANKPTLGLCFGAQLMAAALGARVTKGPANEIGWTEITLTPTGRESALAPLVGQRVLQWHGDTFELPAGAAHLAETARYQRQAFAHGPHALALQFHLETTAAGLAGWLDDGHNDPELAAAGLTAAQLLADARAAEPATRPAALAVLDAWLLTATA